ncbi:MAG: CopD family protein [Nakamurella sp.]
MIDPDRPSAVADLAVADLGVGGPTSAPQPAATRRPWTAATVVAAFLTAGVGAVLLARWLTGTSYSPSPFGLPDAGAFTITALPVVGFGQEIAGIAVVGLLVVRLLLSLRPAADDALADRLGAATARWAWAWVGCAALATVLTLSDLAGAPLTELLSHRDVVVLLFGTDRVLSVTATLWLAAVLLSFGRRFTGRVGTAVLLVVAAGALLPEALTGHVAHHNQNIVLATGALAVHVVAASVWIGGLLAIIVHLRRSPAGLALVLPWFSAVALGCVLAVGLTGVVASMVMLDDWTALFTTDRGALTLAKTALLIGLVGIGWWHRRRTVGAAVDGRLAPLLRLGAVELGLMAATVGLAVVLSGAA